MLVGYSTRALARHDLLRGVELLAEIGYESVAITLDREALNPYGDVHVFYRQLDGMRRLLDQHGMRSVVVTGADVLLDKKTKHVPTLITADPESRARRIGFISDATDVAKSLGSDCVTLGSGVLPDDTSDDEAFDRLVEGLELVLGYAAGEGVALGFQPEPGAFVDTMERYGQLLARVDAPNFRVTLDLGHVHCQGEVPVADCIRRWADRLVNVQIKDMRAGVHEQGMFGQGDIEFRPMIEALAEVGYDGALHVELGGRREGPEVARQAFELLNPLVRQL